MNHKNLPNLTFFTDKELVEYADERAIAFAEWCDKNAYELIEEAKICKTYKDLLVKFKEELSLAR